MDATTLNQSRHEAGTPSGDSQGERGPLSTDELRKLDAYWRAANYLSVGQIYLQDNPLLEYPLRLEHIKDRKSTRLNSSHIQKSRMPSSA